ncbi:MAG: hypothetical protein ACFNX9_00175 [Eikenella corrodens]|uniref:hypothetical protein n=1 Tax=Eikenella corrodens TaxID=539 RepID=UPI00360D054B
MSDSKKKILEKISKINRNIADRHETNARILYNGNHEQVAQNFLELANLNQKLALEFAKLSELYPTEEGD